MFGTLCNTLKQVAFRFREQSRNTHNSNSRFHTHTRDLCRLIEQQCNLHPLPTESDTTHMCHYALVYHRLVGH
jgi:hypothetical protein